MEIPLQTQVFIENQIELIKKKESLYNIQKQVWEYILKEFHDTATIESMICLSMQLYTKIILQSKKQ